MHGHENFVYEFIETLAGKKLGDMRVLTDGVERRHEPEAAWTSTRNLTNILGVGVDGGFRCAFPD